MPKKKSNTRNGFYFYMVDFRRIKESEGVVFANGLADVAIAAGPSYSGLDPRTKARYDKMAEKAKVAGNGGVRYNTQGQTYEQIDQMKREAEERKEAMLRNITSAVQADGRDGLKHRRFYFIHINHYGKIESEGFIPCEIAFLAYTIERGFEPEHIVHEFLRHMELPNGYTFRAKTHSELSHKCPLPPNALGSSDRLMIYEKIMGLLKKNGDLENGIPPPVYTLQQFIPEAVDFFRRLNNYSHNACPEFQVYPLEELFYQLKNFGVKPEGQHLFFNGIEDKGFPFFQCAGDILKGDVYDFSSGIACQFHEDEDVRQHCSRSYVIRWSYLLSDHLCANLDVKIQNIRHTPRNTNLHAVEITSQMDHLQLAKPKVESEGPRESCGRGKPVDGRTVPTSRTSYPQPLYRDPHGMGVPMSYASVSSRSSSRASSSQDLPVKPLTIIDHSQFQSDDSLPGPSVQPVPEDAPLRQPRTKGKSSIMLNMCGRGPITSPTPSENGDAYPAMLGGIGRGRGMLKNL